MSAFLVSNEHIRVLVWAGRRTARPLPMAWTDSDGQRRRHEPAIGDTIGQKLLDQNQRSINHRYDESRRARLYVNRPPRRDYTPAELLKAIAGYECQSRETPDWPDTEAARYCDELHHAIVRLLPGYRDAETWCIEEPAPIRPVRVG